MLKFMTQLLSKHGYEVKTARDGLEALGILRGFVPDVAFIDLVMPNIGGDKLCRILRGMSQLEKTRLIILSAVAIDQAGELYRYGADGCIAKGSFAEMAKQVLSAVEGKNLELLQASSDSLFEKEEIHLHDINRELLSLKRHLEVVMMSMAEGILEINNELVVVYANPSALSLIGIPEEKLLGVPLSILFEKGVLEKILQIIKNPGAVFNGGSYKPVIQLNGKEIAVHVSPVLGEQHKTIIVLNDITEQKHMEAQLQQAQKMEAIGTLAGGIAHDFNNLLMAIQGTVSLILFTMDPDHPQYKKIESIEKQVESGAKLTSQLLGYARKGKYEIKPIDLNHLIRETTETFARTKKEITVRQNLSPNLYATEADEGQIEQILLNLYVNAASAMPNGGHLVIETRNATDTDMKGELYRPKPGSYVLLTVTDTGSGMDENTKKRIFEPFFTTKEMGRGTGLGLASAYGIVKNHGGYIDVDSQLGKGTTFKIYLPASEKPAENTAVVKNRDDVSKGHETILLVDDERMILEVGKDLLEEMGYDVITAKDGKEAVEIYKARKNDIDLLILDIIMPEMNGGDVYDTMKKINPDIKVLLSSGYSVEGQAAEILARGCDGFIQKPFHMGQLSQSIRQILQQ
jgi:PAS domain S-box-containing protein